MLFLSEFIDVLLSAPITDIQHTHTQILSFYLQVLSSHATGEGERERGKDLRVRDPSANVRAEREVKRKVCGFWFWEIKAKAKAKLANEGRGKGQKEVKVSAFDSLASLYNGFTSHNVFLK